jgi:SAM-dependent methyltransferase
MTGQRGEYRRTGVYLEGGGGSGPKHMFVRIGDLIARRADAATGFDLLDVGAAAGAFAAYALGRFPGARVTGLEHDPALVEAACANCPAATFVEGDANRMSGIADRAFDVVTMTGTHSIFDDFRPSFAECVRVARDGGTVVITGLFNPHPVDAQVHWRYGAQFEAAWHPGYNLFSHLSVSTFLEAHPRVRRHEFVPFALPFDIAPREDPIRSWTEVAAGGERILRNGIMPLPFDSLVIDVGAR